MPDPFHLTADWFGGWRLLGKRARAAPQPSPCQASSAAAPVARAPLAEGSQVTFLIVVWDLGHELEASLSHNRAFGVSSRSPRATHKHTYLSISDKQISLARRGEARERERERGGIDETAFRNNHVLPELLLVSHSLQSVGLRRRVSKLACRRGSK